jgi:hypothetical protein
MNKFKNPMIAAVVLGGLGLIGSLMNSHPPVQAATLVPPINVAIDPSTLPLHVTGSATVAGTVAATQSGPWNVAATQSGLWNVGITGQPIGVNLNNTPSVTVAGTVAATQSGLWSVGIVAGTTVLIKNLDEPGRVPYQESKNVSGDPTGVSQVTFSAVPANTRLVIREISVDFLVKAGGAVGAGSLGSAAFFPPPQSLYFPLTFQGPTYLTGFDEWVANQQVTFYVNAGQQPLALLTVDPPHAAVIGENMTLTGYYVSLP